MHATVRKYVGNADFANKLARRQDEITALISGVPRLHAYYLIRAGNDTISVTVCDEETGTQQSNEVAASWIRENMPDAVPKSPEITAGDVVITTH